MNWIVVVRLTCFGAALATPFDPVSATDSFRAARRAPRQVVQAGGAAQEPPVADTPVAPSEADRADELGDERVEPFQPRRPRTEWEEDRNQAAALYAHGRLLAQRDRPLEALRRYQRALRYDPGVADLRREIVSLAVELDRTTEALRYAAFEPLDDSLDAAALLRLAAYASEQRDWRRAVVLYRAAADRQARSGALDFTYVLLQLELGRLQFLTDKPAEAAAALAVVRDALDHPEKYGLNEPLKNLILDKPEATYALLAEVFFQAGRWDDAEAMFERLQALRPQRAMQAYRKARLAEARGEPAAALRQLDVYFELQADDADEGPYELLGRCLIKLAEAEAERAGEPAAKAIETAEARCLEKLETLLAKKPDLRPLDRFLADRLRRAGRYAEAMPRYRRLAGPDADVEIFAGWIDSAARLPDDRELLTALARTTLALHSLEPVLDVVQPLAQDAPRLAALVAQVSPAPSDVPKSDVPKSAKDAEQGSPKVSEERSEKQPGATLAVGLLTVLAERFELAEALLERAAGELEPGAATVLPLWGLEMLAADQPGRAVRGFRRAIDERVRPESNRLYYYHLIGALELAGRTDEALAAGREATEAGQDSPLLESRLAWVVYHARRYDAAEAAYLRLLETHDDDAGPAAREAVREARLAASHLASLRKDGKAAEELLEQVLDEHPDDVGAANDLAYLWAERGAHLQRALSMSRRAVEREPKNRAYLDTLGWVLYRLGRWEPAREQLERAAAIGEPDGVILEHLGDCLQQLGRTEEAAVRWRAAEAAFRQEGDEPRRRRTEQKLASPAGR